MTLATRNTRIAVVEETTEGTPVAPSSTGQYLAVQPDFAITPGFESLENAELKGSIGTAKSIRGLEQPTASFSHYLKHSGTEGAVPDWDLLAKSAFGDKIVESTEYDTVSSSTAGTSAARAVINVDTGEGAQFERGQGLLIKDGTNGYNIRCVRSVSSDALSLNFNLSSAPASGVNLGKAVMYKPANSGHAPLSVWGYRANGGLVEMMSGGQVTEMSFEAAANQLINASFSLEGDKVYHNPIEIASADRYLDFHDGSDDYSAVVEAKFYTDPHELAAALETSMNSLGAPDTYTVSYNDTGAQQGKFTIATDGSTLTLKWSTGTNTANTIGDKIGFSVGADDSGATSYNADNVLTYSSPQTPSLDSSDPIIAKDHEVMLGSFSDFSCIQDGVQSVSFSMTVEKPRPGDVCRESGKGASTPNSRLATVEISAILEQHDLAEWKAFRANDTVEFQYSFGTKTGGNWDAGKCGALYFPDATITSIELTDSDGIVTMNLSIQAFVDSSGNGEVYLNLL